MKSTKLISTIAFAFMVLFAFNAEAQDFKPLDKSPMDRAYYPAQAPVRAFAKTDEEKKALEPQIRVTYSRPAKKGRVIFGDLLKYGEAWRIGANESTEILFVNDVTFGGKTISAGRYSAVIIPTENEWTLKLNNGLDGWGNFGYDDSKDVVSVTAPVSKSEEVIENLSIALYLASENTVHLKIGWDNSVAEFPITIK